MPAAKVSKKGQIVIPQEIREALGIRAGDVLEFVLDGAGALSVRRAVRIPIDRLEGAWRRSGDPHLSDEDISAAIREAASRRRA